MSRRALTVSELLAQLNALLEEGFTGVTVEGELTNVRLWESGHLYFALKDGSATLECVMWGQRAGRLKFRAEDGLAVLAIGSLAVYPARGKLQMVVDDLQPQGMGALQLAFEQLKRRLAAEGLFAPERKRPLPSLPTRVGLVTSLAGAAVRDMLKVLRRFPHVEVVVAPARVQGDGAATEIAEAVARLGGSGLVDVVIIGRGGGSLEDLWAFNEEAVARAVAACPVPVISGVGHEVDFTIADFVADVRAATPTQAAELVVARLEEQERRLRDANAALVRDLRRHLQLAQSRLSGLLGSSGLARLPQRVRLLAARLAAAERLPGLVRRQLVSSQARLEQAEAGLRRLPARLAAGVHRQLLASRRAQLAQLMSARLARLTAEVAAAERGLQHLSPTRVLERGYSITIPEGGVRPLRTASGVRPGQVLVTTLAQGRLRSVVAGGGAGTKAAAGAAGEQRSLFELQVRGDEADEPTGASR